MGILSRIEEIEQIINLEAPSTAKDAYFRKLAILQHLKYVRKHIKDMDARATVDNHEAITKEFYLDE